MIDLSAKTCLRTLFWNKSQYYFVLFTIICEIAKKRTWNSRLYNFATQMFKLIILHNNSTDMICQNDGEEAKSISLTKRYIFIN